MHLLLRLLPPVVLALLVLTGASAAELPRLLLPAADPEATVAASGRPRIPATSRQFHPNPELAAHDSDWLRPGARLQLDLVERQEVTLEVEQVVTTPDGATEVSGRAAGDPDSSVSLVWHGGRLSGVARFTGLGDYHWIPQEDGTIEISRLPSCRSLTCATLDHGPEDAGMPLASRGVERHMLENGVWDPATEPVVLDVLLLYSNTALAAEGNEETLRARILRNIDSANFRFTNSLVGVRLNPVFVGPLAWIESGSITTDWETFQFDSRVQTLRDNFKADLVYLFVEAETFGFGGIGSIPPAGGNPDRAFSVQTRNMLFGRARDVAFTENFVFTHETGHMLGAHHDYLNTFDANGNPSTGAYNYSYGYRFEADDFTYTTIMAYEPGIPVPYSNPNLTFQGVPLGITNSAPVPTDNAQTLNRLAPYVARYRTALSRVGFTQGRYSVNEADGTVTLGLSRQGDLNTATRVSVGFDLGSVAKADLDYTRPASFMVAFATNQSTAEFTFPLLQDDLTEGDEPLRLNLGGIQGNHGLGEWGSTVVTIRDDEASVVTDPAEVILSENSGEAEITVEFTGALAAGQTRVFPVESGRDGDTGTSGTDVVVEPSQVTFSETERRRTIHVRSLSDALEEADETLQIGVGNSVARVRILDDDRVGRLLPMAEADDTVSVLRVLPSGNVLIGGDFTTLNGTSRLNLAEIRPDGTVDPGFTPPGIRASPVSGRGLPPARINALVQDRQGRWLVGGYLGLADGERAGNLVRLGTDGRRDPTFKSPGFNGGVWNVLEQPDGQILVLGVFSKVGTRNARGLARLHEDGSWDETFQSTPGFEGWNVRASALAALPDGRLLVGGILEKYNGTVLRNLVRLLPDGSLDPSFPLLRSGTSGTVNTIVTLPDGRAYIGGFFSTIGGRPARKLARLTADGSVDPTFVAPNPNAEVNCLLPLPNGQLLVGGAFTRLANTPRRFVALLNEDGSIDPGFDLGSGAGDHVWAMAASGDGSLYLGGAFTSFNHQPARRLARLRLPSIAGAFHAPAFDPDGTFSSRVLGLPGAVYAVESSLGLGDWQPMGNVTLNAAGTAQFIDTDSANASTRLYRLRTP